MQLQSDKIMPSFSSIDEAFAFIESFANFERLPPGVLREYRLDRMARLFEIFDNPHLKLPGVHIAGSKGKGSTAHLIASILSKAGVRNGLYTSPHILHYRERFRINGLEAEDSLLMANIQKIIEHIPDMNLSHRSDPTTFELLTLLAFMTFNSARCECNVIETGLGGRLDATNLVDPVCTIITAIELEHCDVLGDTLEKIAFEKGGIIKRGKPLYIGKLQHGPDTVIEKLCIERSAPLLRLSSVFRSEKGASFSVLLDNSWQLLQQSAYLPGSVQKENAGLAAISSWQILGSLRPLANSSKKLQWIQDGISATRIPGRFETFVTTQGVYIVIDGAHTAASMSQLFETFRERYGDETACLFGMVDGKDINTAVKMVLSCFKAIHVSRPGTFKLSNIEELYGKLIDNNDILDRKLGLYPKAEAGLDALLEIKFPAICVVGSFYLAGIVKQICIDRGYSHVN